MKNNWFILGITFGLLLTTGVMTCSLSRTQGLYKRFVEQGMLSSQVKFRAIDSAIMGESLVLYDVSHANYPMLSVRRMQIKDSQTLWMLSLQGIHGSLIHFFQHAEPYTFKNKLLVFNPQKQLLQEYLMTLAVLGDDLIDADLLVLTTVNSANQLTCDVTVKNQGKVLVQLQATITPSKQNAAVFQTLQESIIPFRVTYLDAELKKRLDDYMRSKQLPLMEKTQLFPFRFK